MGSPSLFGSFGSSDLCTSDICRSYVDEYSEINDLYLHMNEANALSDSWTAVQSVCLCGPCPAFIYFFFLSSC